MPSPRFDALDPARKAAILEAAVSEFAARGYSAASYNEIIRNAGLSKGAMYYYFADKADLCRTAIEQVFEHLHRQVGALEAFDDAAGYWRAVHALSERATQAMLQRPDLAALSRLVYGEGGNPGVVEELARRAEVWLRGLLEQGLAVGAIRGDLPLDFLATTVMGVCVHADRYLATSLANLPSEDLEGLSLATLELVERMARPRGTNETKEEHVQSKNA